MTDSILKEHYRAHKKRQQYLLVFVLLTMMNVLPFDAGIVNASFRLAIWIIFASAVVGFNFLKAPGPSSWFVISMLVSYATWTQFYITGSLFYSDTQSFIVVLGSSDPTLGFAVDTGCFTFTCLAWIILNYMGPRHLFDDSLVRRQSSNPGLSYMEYWVVIGLGVIGYLASAFAERLPSTLIQPVLLLSILFPFSIAILVVFGKSSGTSITKMWIPITLVIACGFIGFLATGSKGLIFLSLFFLIWLYGYIAGKTSWSTVIYGGIGFICFLVLLPALQLAKLNAVRDHSMRSTLNGLIDGLTRIGSDDRSAILATKKPILEEMWEYIGIRLCMSSTTRIYFRTYGDAPRGPESIVKAVMLATPRIIDPDKESSNEYYNNIAREAGVGNYRDITTSRKPNFMEEFVVAFGKAGFWIGGACMGLYLVLIEKILVWISRGKYHVLVVLRYSLLTLGQLPYLAVIFGASPFVLAFATLILSPIALKFAKNQRLCLGGLRGSLSH